MIVIAGRNLAVESRVEVARRKRRRGVEEILFRCVCGVEKWVRAQHAGKHFRVCDCKPVVPTTRQCGVCREEKPVDQFYARPSARGGVLVPRERCKTCHSTTMRAWRQAKKNNVAAWQAQKAAQRLANEVQRKQRKLRFFNISIATYEQLLVRLGPYCNICGLPEQRADRKRLSLDHDHSTNIIRGLLCSRCNTLLGLARDEIGRLERAAAYLRSPPATAVLTQLGAA